MDVRPPSKSGFALLPILAAVVVAAGLWLAREAILSRVGTFLDIGGPPQKAEAALVLAGGWSGERVLKAGELVREGYVPFAILDGTQSYYEVPECEAAIQFAVKRGFSAGSFRCLLTRGHSTQEEAVDAVRELRRLGVKKVLLVSVNTHLRRARRIFSQQAPELETHYVGAENPSFKLAEWYKSREGRKAVFLEMLKVVTGPFGV